MVRTAGEIVSLFSLTSCIGCGMCDNVCPSGRNGGIHPDATIRAIIELDRSSDMSALHAESWRCLMCHRCSMTCPKNIDVAGAIRSIRYDSASSGGSPRRFKKASDTLVTEGRAFPVNDYVNQKREELGLNRIENDEASVKDLKTIMSRTGFRNE